MRRLKDLIRNCSSACAWELRGKEGRVVVVGVCVEVVGTGGGGSEGFGASLDGSDVFVVWTLLFWTGGRLGPAS